MKNLFGKNSNNIEVNLNELEKQFKSNYIKIKTLEDKLIERDNGTLKLTQKLEEQVINLKKDLDDKHQFYLTQKNHLLQTNQIQIQNLNIQLQVCIFYLSKFIYLFIYLKRKWKLVLMKMKIF